MHRARQLPTRSLWLPLAVSLWCVAITVGAYAEWNYSRTAGAAIDPGEQWPAESGVVRDHRPTLLLFVHPRCPCSVASLGELAALLDEAPGSVDAHVLFWQPPQAGPEWRDTQLVQQARELPGVAIHWDEAGAESAHFGALTSGHTVCYDAHGTRQFAGGITLGRGQVGTSAGRTAIRNWLQQGQTPTGPNCVYGCPLTTVPLEE